MNWWKRVVAYQIYPKSFYDSNGDGIGDLKGIEMKIPYIAKLGVGAIWISPFFLSPMIDNGYDVQDYKKINPIFGTMEDFESLVKTCNKYDIKIIVDFVANHTSDQHEWFQKALKGDQKYRDYYFFTKNPVWEKKSVFGGEAWEKINDEYYLHSFAVSQPDVNWENINVRNEYKEIMNFWIGKGVYGIRFDVIDDIGKTLDPEKIKKGETVDLNKLHKYVKEWREESKWKDLDLLTVGESWDSSVEKAILYTNPERKELAMVFGFEHISSNWEGPKWTPKKFDLVKFKKIIAKWQMEIYEKGWLALFLSNHDLPRMISNFGDEKYRVESGKCLALTLHMLQGTPFIYQGEEIGMTNCKFNSLDEHDDIEIHQMFESMNKENPSWTKEQHLQYVAKMNRDNARTPFQWSDEENAGFTTNNKPWIKVNENYKEINANENLNNADSLFYWYQKLINLRKDQNNQISEIIINGSFNLVDENNASIFSYERIYDGKKITVIANWTSNDVDYEFAKEDVILNTHNNKLENNKLLPWQAIVIFEKNK